MNVSAKKKKTEITSIAMIISMLIFGTVGLVVRRIDLSSVECAFFRALIAIVVIGVLRIWNRERIYLKLGKKQSIWMLISGVALGSNWILLFQAYQYTTVSIATLCYYLAPVFVILATPLFLKEKLTKRQLFCFFMIMAGFILTLDFSSVSFFKHGFLGIWYGIGAAVCYAILILTNKKIEGVSASDRSLLQFITSAIVLLVYLLCSGGFHVGQLDTQGIISLIVLGVVHTAFAYYLYFYAINRLPVVKIAIYGYLDPVTAIALSIFILKETLTTVQIIGAIMILGFTLYHDLAGYIHKDQNVKERYDNEQ